MIQNKRRDKRKEEGGRGRKRKEYGKLTIY